jgi:hypothetical protein
VILQINIAFATDDTGSSTGDNDDGSSSSTDDYWSTYYSYSFPSSYDYSNSYKFPSSYDYSYSSNFDFGSSYDYSYSYWYWWDDDYYSWDDDSGNTNCSSIVDFIGCPTSLPTLTPTQQPTFAPYELVSITSSIRLSGFSEDSFTSTIAHCIKKAMVKVISVISSTSQIIDMFANDTMTYVDVYFTLDVQLLGVVPRTNDDEHARRLMTEFDGSPFKHIFFV